MKKFKTIISLVLCMSFLMCSVSAVTLDKTVVDMDKQTVSVSGNIPGGKGANVTIQILNPGKGEEDVKNVTPLTFSEVFANVFQVKCDDEGNFKTPAWELSDKSGRYSVRVMWNKTGSAPKLFPEEFLYISPDFNEQLLAALKDENEVGEAFVKENINIIMENTDEYNTLSNEQKTAAVKRAVAEKAELEGKEYKSVSAFTYVLDVSIMLEKMLSAENVKDADEFFLSGAEKYKLYEKATPISLYMETLSKEKREEILSKALKEKTVTDFVNYVSDNSLLTAIKGVDNYSHVEEIILSNSEWMGIETKAYEKLKNKKSINKALALSDCDTVEEMAELFTKQVKKAKESGSVTSSGGSGGGGGGAVSSGGGITADFAGINGRPVVKDEPTPQPPAEDVKEIFEDMASFSWAKEAVNTLYAEKIINGVSEKSFAPERNITREEFVKLLYGAFYSDDLNYTSDFDDVNENDWFYPYVSAAYKKGLVSGVSEKSFGASKNITRQDMTVMAYRFAKEKGILTEGDALTFSDADEISDYAKEAVEKMSAAKVINGTGEGKFSPKAFSNRAQAAQIVYNLYKMMKEAK